MTFSTSHSHQPRIELAPHTEGYLSGGLASQLRREEGSRMWTRSREDYFCSSNGTKESGTPPAQAQWNPEEIRPSNSLKIVAFPSFMPGTQWALPEYHWQQNWCCWLGSTATHLTNYLWAFSWFSTLVIVFNFTTNTIRAHQCTTTKIDLTSHWMSLCIKFVSNRPTIKVPGRVPLPADEHSCRKSQ